MLNNIDLTFFSSICDGQIVLFGWMLFETNMLKIPGNKYSNVKIQKHLVVTMTS